MPPRLPPVGRNLVNQRSNKKDVATSNSGGLPAEITCYMCKKSKPRSQYANRQLQRFADTIHNPYAPAGRCLTDPKTTCRSCTPQQTTELTCCICNKVKGLTGFAKNQRKNPDTARCIKCVNMHLDYEPGGELDESAGSSDTDDADGDFDDDDDGSNKPAASSTRKVRRTVGHNVAAGQDEDTPPDSTGEDFDLESPPKSTVGQGEGGWQNVTTAGVRAPAMQKNLPAYTGPSPAAGPSYQSSYRGSGSQNVGRGGWAKASRGRGQGQDLESDVWDNYARKLTNRRDATKKTTKKKKASISDDDDEDDWD